MTAKVRRHDPAMCGVDLIALERARQIHGERWSKKHDEEHDEGSLVLAAICYAAPRRIYTRNDYGDGVSFDDPWPASWDEKWDKRAAFGDGPDSDSRAADPSTYTYEERLDLLVKAGALIAAEIDRMKRAAKALETDAP
jgi:hypothetical protein